MNKITIDSIDYKEVGLCCGLELHQQLDTGKLFCKCKSKLIKDGTKPDKIIKRKLRPVYSESGEIDQAAVSEHKKQKTYTYYFYNNCNCLVEVDCQPPIRTNPDALRTAIIVSKLTNSQLVDKSIVMRKQVIDGSNVSGFQRTTMISTNGYLDFDFGRVRIDKILLEEDSARAIERKENEVIYSLDRLGIPLIELVVWHDMHKPEDVKTVARNVGQIFRITGKAKRGLGSIRQDINISIKNGNRTEIKGCQELDMIPEIIDREIIRQLSLLEVKKEIEKKNIKQFNIKEKKLTEIFKETTSKAVRGTLENNKDLFGFLIPNLRGIIGYEIQPNRRVGTEISSVLKAKTSLKGLFHSDELPNYGITQEEVNEIKQKLSSKENDAFIVVMCKPEEIKNVKQVIEERLNQLLLGIPKETRIVTPEGNTEYQRPLSVGGSRMYPETDLLPISYTTEILENAEKEMPLSIEKRKELYTTLGLSTQLIEKMVLDNYAVTFEKIIRNNSKLNPTQVAVFLLEDLITMSREGSLIIENVFAEDLIYFFSYERFNEIPKPKIKEVFLDFINSEKLIEDVIDDLKIFSEMESIDAEKIMLEIIEENKEKIQQLQERAEGLLMGRLMTRTKGLIDGSKANSLVKSKLNEFLEKQKVIKY